MCAGHISVPVRARLFMSFSHVRLFVDGAVSCYALSVLIFTSMHSW
jgi:hypothetical protein